MITNHRDVKHPYGKIPEAPSSLSARMSEQKAGLPPAHAKTMYGVANPETRRRLSRIFCGHGVGIQKNMVQFPPPGYVQTQRLNHVLTRLYKLTIPYILRRVQSLRQV